jgi:uncharacterized protein YdaU (DUF1376 family)
MPLYVGDYLQATGHLTTAEHGCYLLLLMHAWSHGGALPGDEDRLRRIGKMDAKAWAASRDTILEFFYRAEDGYRQKRVDRELDRAQSVVEKRQEDRGAATERMRRWRAKNDPDHPPPKPNGDASVTRHKAVTSQSPTASRDGAGDGSVTRASQLQVQVQVQQEEGNKVSNLIPLTGDTETRARAERKPDEPLPEPFAVHVRRVAAACRMTIHYPTSGTRSEQLDVLEAASSEPQPEVAPGGDVIPFGYRFQPQDPVRSVEEQKAWLEAEMAKERGAA